jgi:hypothetical protein
MELSPFPPMSPTGDARIRDNILRMVTLKVHEITTAVSGPGQKSATTGQSRPQDSLRVHKALLNSLGVNKPQAGSGVSDDSVQPMEWSVNYPDYVECVINGSFHC